MNNKLVIALIVLIIILGLFIRFSHAFEETYWGDDMTTIPTGLLFFYPHTYYPGLAGQGEPALGNYLIGLGCMASGQDFSKVTQIQPMFYPGRPQLIGKEMVAAEPYCHSSMYIFGILFFTAVIILAFLILDKYSAIFASVVFAFLSYLLQLSRWIHVDVIGYFFVVVGLIFLWLFYKKETNERLWVILAGIGFGLAFAVKLPNAIFLIFMIFIVLLKYKEEIKKLVLNKYDTSVNNLFINAAIAVASFLFAVFIAFGNFGNVISVIQKYGSINPEHSFIALNKFFFADIGSLLMTFNSLELIIWIFSIYIFLRLLLKKKDKAEQFIFYLYLLFWAVLLLFPAMNYTRVVYVFIPAIVFMMALAFSDKEYSIFNTFKIPKKEIVYPIFIVLLIVVSFFVAYQSSPLFIPHNKLLCTLNLPDCSYNTTRNFNHPFGMSAKYATQDLSNVMKDNETFLGGNEMYYYYIRQDESYALYAFISQVRSQINRRPNLNEFIEYYKPYNRTLRYLVVNPGSYDSSFPEFETFKKDYTPNILTKVNGVEAAYIYDLENLKKK